MNVFMCVEVYVSMIAFVCEHIFFLCVWVCGNMITLPKQFESNLELPGLASELASVDISRPCL